MEKLTLKYKAELTPKEDLKLQVCIQCEELSLWTQTSQEPANSKVDGKATINFEGGSNIDNIADGPQHINNDGTNNSNYVAPEEIRPVSLLSKKQDSKG